MTQLLRSAQLEEGRREELHQRIHSNGRLLLSLVDDLLDLSKVESNKLAIELGPVPVLRAVIEVMGSLDAEAKRKGLRLSVEMSGGFESRAETAT